MLLCLSIDVVPAQHRSSTLPIVRSYLLIANRLREVAVTITGKFVRGKKPPAYSLAARVRRAHVCVRCIIDVNEP